MSLEVDPFATKLFAVAALSIHKMHKFILTDFLTALVLAVVCTLRA